MSRPKYADENGYFRWVDNNKLVHRDIAYSQIYVPNEEAYPNAFSDYVVHHIDHDKKNNTVPNLQIVTQKEHEEIHGIDKTSPNLFYWLISAGSIWYAPGLVLVDLFGENSSILIVPKILLGIFIIATIITTWVSNVKLKKYAQVCLAVLYALASLAFFRIGSMQEIYGFVIVYSRWLYLTLGIVFGFVAFFKFKQEYY